MKFLGLFSTCEVTSRFKSDRFSKYYSHSTTLRGKEVKWYEVIEDITPQPAVVTKRNMKEYHQFFTQPQFI